METDSALKILFNNPGKGDGGKSIGERKGLEQEKALVSLIVFMEND